LTEDCITHGILSDDPQIVMMQNMFPAMTTTVKPPRGPSHAEDVRYSSDESSHESDSESESDSNADDESSKLMP
jgi:N-acyl-L-homoserine lactone synthetase